MGLEDRDYLRSEPRSNYGYARRSSVGMRAFSVTMWLIIINVAVFVLDLILGQILGKYPALGLPVGDAIIPVTDQMNPLYYWGYFSIYQMEQLQIWRVITFQFLHANLTHIAFNMIALFFFGPLVETYLGARRFAAFYLLCGVSGAASYILLRMAHVLIAGPWVPLVGASAGIFGILIAAAQIAPDAKILIYGVLPMKLRVAAWLLFAYAVYTVLTAGSNAGGEAAHLGGALLGFGLIRAPRLLDIFDPPRRRR